MQTMQPYSDWFVPTYNQLAHTQTGFAVPRTQHTNVSQLIMQAPKYRHFSAPLPPCSPSGPTVQVKQPLLVKDVLRAVQGLKGAYMHFPAGAQAANPADDSAGLRLEGNDQARIPEGQRTLIHELGELGLMFM